jgi:hypothetical protein
MATIKCWVLVTLLGLGVLSSCANYEIGDASARYCTVASPESRVVLSAMAAAAGLTVPDYCASLGVAFIILGEVTKDID